MSEESSEETTPPAQSAPPQPAPAQPAKKESWWKQHKGATMAGVAAGGAVVGATAATAKGAYGSARNLVSDPGFSFLFLFSLGLFFYDWLFLGFARNSPAAFSTALTLYSLLGIAAYFRLASVEGSGSALKRVLVYSLLSIFAPLLFAWLGTYMHTTFLASFEAFATFSFILGHAWAPLVLLYMLWPRFMLSVASQKVKLLAAINISIYSALFLFLIPVLFTPLIENQSFFAVNQDAPPSVLEVAHGYAGHWVGVYQDVRGRGEDEVDALLNRTLPTRYTSQVERQQGEELGVIVTNPRSLLPYYEYYVMGQPPNISVEPAFENQNVEWMATLRARTFASDIPVSLSCVYQRPQGAENRSDLIYGTARPPSLTVRYTGESMDVFNIDCAVPLAALPYTEPNFQAGQFQVRTNFSFETWGYTTYHFMDVEQIRSLRIEGREPAQVLGLRPLSTAIYTPGPVSLGMPQISLPVAVDTNETVVVPAIVPAMGVTIENAWRGRGQITDIDYVVVQVPLPFTLNTDSSQCSGVGDAEVTVLTDEMFFDPRAYSDSYSGLEGPVAVTPGYTWYVFTGVGVPERFEFITLRCPVVTPARQGAALLNPDLSPRQFTFVTQARYTYETTNIVPINLRLVRQE